MRPVPSGVAPYTGWYSDPHPRDRPINGAGAIASTASGAQAIQFGTSASSGSGVFSGVISNGTGTMTVIRGPAPREPRPLPV